jgi:hypothetical protein
MIDSVEILDLAIGREGDTCHIYDRVEMLHFAHTYTTRIPSLHLSFHGLLISISSHATGY